VIIGRCEVCGHELDDAVVSIVRHVEGWEPMRGGKGGGNGLIDRQELGHIAHAQCMKRRANQRRRGIADEQGTLV
jgi:hypothetical protein